MNIIQTSAPIKLEDLKKYFEDKTTFFVIDYSQSTLKADKLLVYISNLDLPCDLKINSREELQEIVTAYMNSNFLVDLPSVEQIVISLLLQNKNLIDVKDTDLLEVLKDNLSAWTEKLDSLPLYNMYLIQDETFKKWVTEEHPIDDTTDTVGINFVSLLKNETFYSFYQTISSTPKYYSGYFNEYMFKGKNMYEFWANENNPMFLLTHAIASGNLNTEEYIDSAKNAQKELTEL